MDSELRTLALFLSLTNLLQVVALFAQSWANKTYRGLEWWALGGLSGGLAFGFNFLRASPVFGEMALISSNLLFVSGLLLPYLGTLQFFERPFRRGWLIAFGVAFSLLTVYFTVGVDSVDARRFLTSGSLAVFSWLIAWNFLHNRLPSIRFPVYFLSAVFFANGLFLGARALFGDLSASLPPSAIYLVTLVNSMLWTFGFILLINQRLYAETHEAKEKFELIFNTSPDAILVTRLADGQLVIVNEAFTVLTGFGRDEVLGKPVGEINFWENPSDLQELGQTLGGRGHCENLEAVFRRKDGSQLIGIFSARLITLQGSAHVISLVHDITERKSLERELHRRATTDGLTEVSNRSHFVDLARLEIARAQRFQYPLTLALIDVDHLKQINDTYGHAAGDRALVTLAGLCRKNIREIDLFARFGGDEFVLLLPQTTLEQAYEIVKRICVALDERNLQVDARTFKLTLSAGLANLAGEQLGFDALLRQADQALYGAKEAGRNRICVESASQSAQT